MAVYTYTANIDPHDHTRILRLRDGALVVEMGHAADFYPEEVASLSSRVVLTPGAAGPISEPGTTQFIRLQDLLDVPRPLQDNDVLAFDFGQGDFKAIQVVTADQLATKQDAATAATDAELTAHANIFGRGGHIPTGGLTTAELAFDVATQTELDAAVAAVVPKATFAAIGDLLVASAVSTPTRLAVGGNAQVLTVDSTQPLGLRWATPDVTQAELDTVAAASVILAPTTTARNTVLPTAIGVIPLTLRQAAGDSTTVAVQQWLSSSGSMVAQVNGGGAFQGINVHDRTVSRPYVSLELGAATIGAVARSATQVPWTVQGAASQSGDLQQWQTSAGAVLGKVTAAGRLSSPGIDAVGASGTALLTAWVTAEANARFAVLGDGTLRWGPGSAAADVQLARSAAGALTQQGIGTATATQSITKMVASQSVDPVQVQDSAGVLLTAVTSAGALQFAGDTSARLYRGAASQVNAAGDFQVAGSFKVGTTPSTFAVSSGSTQADVTNASSGGVMRFYAASNIVMRRPVVFGGTADNAATDVPLAVKGAASQTADLLQLQNSTATILSRFDFTGGLHVPTLQVGASTTAGWVLTADVSGNATWAPAAGGGGSTITLQDEGVALGTQRTTWNFVGAGVAATDDAGNGRTNITIPGADLSTTVILAPAASTRNVIQPTAATIVSLVSKGFTSQTADLFQVQDSSATVLSRFDSAGGVHAPSLQIGTSTTAGNLLTADASGNATWVAPDRAPVAILAPTTSTRNTIQPTAATVVPLVSKGFASQTADLFEAQNNAGAVLSKITAAGVNDAVSYTQAGVALASTHLSDSSSLARLASPVFTGDPQAPTPATADNDVSIATTAFVKAQGYLTTVDHSPDVILAPTSSTRNLVQPTGAAFVPLVIRAFASQTADLQQWQNSAGTALSRVAADGSNYVPATLSHTGTLLGVYNVTPVARPSARTMSNWTLGANALRTIDRNIYTPDQLFDFVMTMASDLQAVGLFA